MFKISNKNKISSYIILLHRNRLSFVKNGKTKRNITKEKRDIIESNLIYPILFGVTLTGFGVTYKYNTSYAFRKEVRQYLPDSLREFLDQYVGPDTNIKTKIIGLPGINYIYSLFQSSDDIKDNGVLHSHDSMNLKTTSQFHNDSDGNALVRLDKLLVKLNDNSETVMKLMKEYEEKVILHSDALKRAIEDNGLSGKDVWRDVEVHNEEQIKAKGKAEAETSKLDSIMTRIEKTIVIADSNALAGDNNNNNNEKLETAHKKMNEVRDKLNDLRGQVDKAQFVSQMTNEYRHLVEEGREKFHRELEALGTGGSGHNQDMSLLVLHAHRKIEQLQSQLAELEAMESLHVAEAVNIAQESISEQVKKAVDIAVEKERKLMNVEREKDIRDALTRQAGLHSEHLAELLRIQRQEVERHQNMAIREALLHEREKLRGAIEGWRMRVEGLEAAVEGRADAEKAGREAQDLWVACHGLRTALVGGIGSEQINLSRLLNNVEEAAQPGESRERVRTLLSAIPVDDVTGESEIPTLQSLNDRFPKVKLVCSNVSMLDETGGGLVSHLLSWLRYKFLLSPGRILTAESEVDVACDDIDCNVILTSAERAISCGNVELAVRILGLLKGMPRAVADDWLKDARKYLEASQAVEALSGYTHSRTATVDVDSLMHCPEDEPPLNEAVPQ